MSSFFKVFENLNLQILILSALLFFIGYAFAPTAYYKKIKWLTAYPFFIIKLMDSFFKKEHATLKIFFILFLLNSFSLFINLISAWGIILPFFLIIYMGLNVGVVIYHSLEGRFYYTGLLNPVAMLELPAAWLSIAMAIQFSLTHFFKIRTVEEIAFSVYLDYFLYTVIPLLLAAGIIETLLIKLGSKTNHPED
jgi:hypothetical protein